MMKEFVTFGPLSNGVLNAEILSLMNKAVAHEVWTPPKHLVCEAGEHGGKRVLLIRFPYDRKLIDELKHHLNARWSASKAVWHVPDTPANRRLFGLSAANQIGEKELQVAAINNHCVQRLVETIHLRGYSSHTESTYRTEFVQFLVAMGKRPVDDIDAETLRNYLLRCVNVLKMSEAHIHSRLNAIKFYYEKVLHRERMFVDIPRPKKASTLPKAIARADVKKLIEGTTNLKHNTMLKMCYGMGLRVSEIVALRLCDIDTASMQVHIVRAKGKKDRYVPLPASILGQLQEYCAAYKPEEFLFEGRNGPYTSRSAQAVFKQAMKRAGIVRQIGIHSLRHSYARHLLEAGTDIGHIQKLLGHESISTTLIYTKISNRDVQHIQSPLDTL